MLGSNSRELSIVLRLQDQVSQELKGVRGQLESMQPTFRRMAVAGTAAFAAITAGVGKTVQAAGRAQDISALFNLAFSDTEDRMNAFVDEFSSEFGRARTSIMQMASDMGFALSMGTDLASNSIAGMTEELVFAAEALALADARIDSGEQAMQAFADAMNGSMQQARRYIPTLREANVQQKALEMGLIGVGEELDQSNRAMALHSLIMEGTTLSQQRLREAEGDYTDTKARLNAALQDTVEVMGEQFLPIATELLEAIVPIIRKTGEWVEENPKLTKNLVIATAAVAGLTAVLGTLGIVLLAITPALALLASPIVLVTGLALGLAGAGYYLWRNWETAVEGLKLIWDTLKRLFWQGAEFIMDKLVFLLPGGFIVHSIINNWDSIKEYFSQVWENIVGIFSWASEKIMSFLNPIIETAQRAIDLARRAREMAGGAISGARDRVSGAISRITPFADGGIVTRPTLGLVGEAGPEAIIPLNKAGGLGSVNITITGNSFMGEDDMAERVGNRILHIVKQTTKI